MGVLIDAARLIGVDLANYRVTRGGLTPVETRTKGVKIPKVRLGHGGFRLRNDPNSSNPSAVGSRGGQGNGSRTLGE